jgi:hypothetical protein
MGKYLVLWELDESKIPLDAKERGTAWKAFMGVVKQNLETGTGSDWGSFVGQHKGYAVHEGSEVAVGLDLEKFVPFVRFKAYPISTVDQVDELVEALLK